MRLGVAVTPLLLIACASAPSPNGQTPAIDRWETRTKHILAAAEECSQGPLTARLPALEPTYGRRVLLTIYSPRVLPIHATFHFDRTDFTVHWATGEGERERANAAQARCRVPVEAASSPVATRSPQTPSVPARPGRKPSPASVPSVPSLEKPATPVVAPPRELVALPPSVQGASRFDYALEFWKGELTPVRSVDVSTTSWSGGIQGEIELQLWGDDMLDLRDVVFQVEEQELVPLLALADYERALQAQFDARRAEREQCQRRGGLDCPTEAAAPEMAWKPASRPPPPPREEMRPPAPAPTAVWIAGAWRWTGADYEWVQGMWRLPPAPAAPIAVSSAPPPMEAGGAISPSPPQPPPGRVVARPPSPPPGIQLPPPPPPLRVEVIPAATAAGAVWTAGYWRWDGRAYLWIAGRWQVPPNVRARWQAPQLTVNGAGVTVQLPGGWIEVGY